MTRWFVLLLIIAAFTGVYWAVMSGWAAERALIMGIQHAARENDPLSIQDRLRETETNIDAQQRWVKRFSFINRNPDWSRLNESRNRLHQVQKEASELVRTSGGEVGAEGVEPMRRLLERMAPLQAGVFRPGQETLWKVLFWVSAAGAVLTGLLAFVQRVGE